MIQKTYDSNYTLFEEITVDTNTTKLYTRQTIHYLYQKEIISSTSKYPTYEPSEFLIESNKRFTYYSLPKYSNLKDLFDSYSYIVFVKSSISSFEQRVMIRSIYSNSTLNTKFYFLVGLSMNTNLNHQLTDEQRQYNDMIIPNIYDIYQNLTLKVFLGMDLLLLSKVRTTLILVDDDICINMNLLIQNLNHCDLSNNDLYAGRLFLARPSKYLMSKHSIPYLIDHEVFSFVHGPCIVLSTFSIQKMMLIHSRLYYIMHADDIELGELAKQSFIDICSIPSIFIDYNELKKKNQTLKQSQHIMTHYIKTPNELYSICYDMKM